MDCVRVVQHGLNEKAYFRMSSCVPPVALCTSTVLPFLIYLNELALEAKCHRHMCTGRLCTGFGKEKEKKKRRATVSMKNPGL